MAISSSDTKILWGRAAGKCSNPECPTDLTVLLTSGKSYNLGEMAHVIAEKPSGARGVPEGGSNKYANLILLCPTCHTKIDGAPPGTYPIEMLQKWKSQHEAEVAKVGKATKFVSVDHLKSAVSRLLRENHNLWSTMGPQSETAQSNPASNLHSEWTLRILGTILPNNQKIVNFVEANEDLITDTDHSEFLSFKAHASAFEAHQYNRLDTYPLFPKSFATAFTP